jgi:hypothetical protein
MICSARTCFYSSCADHKHSKELPLVVWTHYFVYPCPPNKA